MITSEEFAEWLIAAGHTPGLGKVTETADGRWYSSCECGYSSTPKDRGRQALEALVWHFGHVYRAEHRGEELQVAGVSLRRVRTRA